MNALTEVVRMTLPPVFEHAFTVPEADIDELGHANNLAYLRWSLDAAVAHSSAAGWSPARHFALGSGWVIRSHTIRYVAPAFAGDRVVVRTWLATMKRATSLRRFDILREDDGTLLAKGATDWAYVAYATGRPTRAPEELIASFVVVPDATAR